MSQFDVHAKPASPTQHRSVPGAGFVPAMVTQWPRIVVSDTDVLASPSGDAAQRTVRACIHLGSLLPVDVRVALVPMRNSVPDFVVAHPLWSTMSYHNGIYLYEATVPTAMLDGGNCVIRVTPATDLPLWRDVLRVIQVPISCDASAPASGGAERTRVQAAATFPLR